MYPCLNLIKNQYNIENFLIIITISYLIISCFYFLHKHETDSLIRHMSKMELYPARD